MIDFDDYNRKNLPAAAQAQLETMVGKQHWDLTDEQRTWLYYFSLYNSFKAHCLSCNGFHYPLDATTLFFTFDQPDRTDAFACPLTGEPMMLIFGGGTEMNYQITLKPHKETKRENLPTMP